MTLVPADGVAWSAPTLHLVPEAGAVAGVLVVDVTILKDWLPQHITYTRLEILLFFAYSSPRLGLCPIISEATSPHLSPALRIPSYSLAVIFGTVLLSP